MIAPVVMTHTHNIQKYTSNSLELTPWHTDASYGKN